jgi:cytoskeleton protein RodZ
MISDSENQMPGGWLRQQREQAGLSVDDAAARLNLLRSQVVALEENRFERLAGPAYVVGYLRNYARMLGMDEDALVGRYYEAFGRPQPAALQVSPVARQTSGFQHRQQRSYAGVAVALAVLGGAWWFGAADRPAMDTDLAESIQVDTAIGTTIIESVEQLPEDEPTRDIVPEVQWSEAVTPRVADESPDAGVAAAAPSLQGTVQQHSWVANDGSAQIRFRFSADCWVEVRNGDSRVIYSSMKRADDILELSGKPPFKVTLGYAPGVSVSYNGEPVSIPSSGSHVARIVLGES